MTSFIFNKHNISGEIIKIFPLIIFILLLNSCEEKKYTLEDIQEIKNTIDTNLHGLKENDFEWASEKAYSDIRAYYPLPGYIFLNEKINFRTGGDSYNHYYFKNGILVFYKERKVTFKETDGNRLRRALSSLDLYLDQDGTVISFENVADKKRTDINGMQVKDIISHSKELYTLTVPKNQKEDK